MAQTHLRAHDGFCVGLLNLAPYGFQIDVMGSSMSASDSVDVIFNLCDSRSRRDPDQSCGRMLHTAHPYKALNAGPALGSLRNAHHNFSLFEIWR